MITKWNRESLLVMLMVVMILIALFFYGDRYLIEPTREEAQSLSETVQTQEALLTAYPPSEELYTEYESAYLETEAYLPIGAQANQELITLEQMANQSNVNIASVTRSAYHQPIEEVPENYVKDTYHVQLSSNSPANFRTLIERLMTEPRVWNMIEFSYDKVGDASYSSMLSLELAYYSNEPNSTDETDETTGDEEPADNE